MKLTFLIAICTVYASDDKKYTNSQKFMSLTTPAWWAKHPAENRLKWFRNNNSKFFKVHFNDKGTNGTRLEKLFNDTLNDMENVKESCQHGGSRNRRDAEIVGEANTTEEEEDFMEHGDKTRKVVGEIVQDTKRFLINIARWIKLEIYNKGGLCEFYGFRMLNRVERLRWFTYHKYCKSVDDSEAFCDQFYRNSTNGKLKKNPRDETHWINKVYQRPSKETYVYNI